MLFLVSELQDDIHKPSSVLPDMPIGDALSIMIQNDFSQLPVVNENEELLGMVTEQSIIKTLYHVNSEVGLMDLPVNHCQVPVEKISLDDDISTALEKMQRTNAVVIVEGNKPIGILTDYDTNQFFFTFSEDLIRVKNIEEALRSSIQMILDTEEKIHAALVIAFGPDEDDNTEPAKAFDDLTFYEHIQLITTKRNWEKFSSHFEPKYIFDRLMSNARLARNKLVHFRGDLDAVEKSSVIRALEWVMSRPRVKSPEPLEELEKEFPRFSTGKYGALKDWLHTVQQSDSWLDNRGAFSMTFESISQILQEPLPDSAFTNNAWWSNHLKTHIHSKAWLSEGFIVDDVDPTLGQVTFRQTPRALYPIFFEYLRNEFGKVRPGFLSRNPGMKNSFTSGAGKAGFYYKWRLPSEPVLQVEFYISRTSEDKSIAAYDFFYSKQADIEEKIGESLKWDKLEGKRASRISVSRPYEIHANFEKDTEILDWGVSTMDKFVDTFTPLIKEFTT